MLPVDPVVFGASELNAVITIIFNMLGGMCARKVRYVASTVNGAHVSPPVTTRALKLALFDCYVLTSPSSPSCLNMLTFSSVAAEK